MIQRIELMPGIRLNTIQTNRFKNGCFSINFLCPLRLADAAPNALLPSILLRGSRQYPGIQEISSRLDDLYGATVGTLVRKKGEVQTIGLYADFLEDRYVDEPVFAEAMAFLRELLFNPCMEGDGFREDFTEGERQNLTDVIASRINDKRAYTFSRLLQKMFEGEAYAVPRLGEEETLSESPKDLFGRYRKMLSEAPVELFYLGQRSQEEICDAMRTLLQDLPADERQCIGTEVVIPNRPVQYYDEVMDVTQGKLSMGFRTEITAADPRYPALLLFNAIYGAGSTSKLFMQLREEQSLCYSVSSSIEKFKGSLFVDSGIDCTNYDRTSEEILHQLDLCKRGDFSGEELESARKYLLSSLRSANDSPGRQDDFAIGQAVAGLTGTMEELAVSLRQVTVNEIIEAAETLRLDTVYFLKGGQT